MDRLRLIVAAAELHPGDVVVDVGTGAGVLIPLLQSYRPSLVLACDLAEQMLARVRGIIRWSLLFNATLSALR